MWIYEKKLQFPVTIKKSDPLMAKLIMTQLGGADGELGASNRYLHQRYSMPFPEIKALLTDIGTEEMAHAELIATMVHQLIKGATPEQIKAAGAIEYYIEHTAGIYPVDTAGIPFNAAAFQSKGDPITDLMEDMAAEQKARTAYDNLLRIAKDPEVCKVLKFLRSREIVHFQRFGEALDIVRKHLNKRNFYSHNPAFDTRFTNNNFADDSTYDYNYDFENANINVDVYDNNFNGDFNFNFDQNYVDDNIDTTNFDYNYNYTDDYNNRNR